MFYTTKEMIKYHCVNFLGRLFITGFSVFVVLYFLVVFN